MAFNEIKEIITTIGFPIAAAVYMAYLNNQQSQRFEQSLDKQNERHEIEVSALTDAINNNTKVITILTERLGNARD